MSNKVLFFLIMGFFAALAALGCWLLLLPQDIESYVPAGIVIERKSALRPFLVKARDVEGVYGGMEVSSLVFRYQTDATDFAGWQRQVESQAQDKGWSKKSNLEFEIIFERLLASQPTRRRRATSEECRLHFNPQTKRITGAWILVDNDRRPDPIASGVRADWARKNLWPEYLQAR